MEIKIWKSVLSCLTLLCFFAESHGEGCNWELSSWSQWTECDQTCGSGTRSRFQVKNCTNLAELGWVMAQTQKIFTLQVCNAFDCPESVSAEKAECLASPALANGAALQPMKDIVKRRTAASAISSISRKAATTEEKETFTQKAGEKFDQTTINKAQEYEEAEEEKQFGSDEMGMLNTALEGGTEILDGIGTALSGKGGKVVSKVGKVMGKVGKFLKGLGPVAGIVGGVFDFFDDTPDNSEVIDHIDEKMTELSNEMKEGFSSLSNEMKGGFSQISKDLENRFSWLTKEMKTGFTQVKSKISSMGNNLKAVIKSEIKKGSAEDNFFTKVYNAEKDLPHLIDANIKGVKSRIKRYRTKFCEYCNGGVWDLDQAIKHIKKMVVDDQLLLVVGNELLTDDTQKYNAVSAVDEYYKRILTYLVVGMRNYITCMGFKGSEDGWCVDMMMTIKAFEKCIAEIQESYESARETISNKQPMSWTFNLEVQQYGSGEFGRLEIVKIEETMDVYPSETVIDILERIRKEHSELQRYFEDFDNLDLDQSDLEDGKKISEMSKYEDGTLKTGYVVSGKVFAFTDRIN